ncbi:MAG: hypothetical protein DMG16_16280 [Acidobacteria bacterium]|nr:MAG: hypothetical protein DMG16_16280 [Acidobacteriota bacterium]
MMMSLALMNLEMERHEALISHVWLQPILMTTISIAAGMLRARARGSTTTLSGSSRRSYVFGSRFEELIDTIPLSSSPE